MINKCYKNKHKQWACLHDQRINKNIATTVSIKKCDKEGNKKQQQTLSE